MEYNELSLCVVTKGVEFRDKNHVRKIRMLICVEAFFECSVVFYDEEIYFI